MRLTRNPVRISGKKLIQLREKFGISQQCLSYEIDLSRCTLNQIEGDKHKEPSLCTAYKLAKYFNVPIETLLE